MCVEGCSGLYFEGCVGETVLVCWFWCWCSKLDLLVLMENIFQKKRFCFILETLNLRWVRQGL